MSFLTEALDSFSATDLRYISFHSLHHWYLPLLVSQRQIDSTEE